MKEDDPRRKIKSLEKTHVIINCLRRTDGATLSEITENVGLTASSVHTYLSTLRGLGYVVKSEDHYKLGPEFITLGEYVRNTSPLYQASKNEVDKLAEKTGEAVHLIIEHNGRGIALYERLGQEAIGTSYHRQLRQTSHQHLHCTASGKAILAELPEERVREIVEEQGLAARTQHSITDPDRLVDELATIRERGYAVNDEEEVLGIGAIGSSICDETGSVLGSIAISTPITRLEDDAARAEIVELAKRATNTIEVNLQTSDHI